MAVSGSYPAMRPGRDPISFVVDIFQVRIFIIGFVFFRIRLTRGCIVDVVVLIYSTWFMEV